MEIQSKGSISKINNIWRLNIKNAKDTGNNTFQPKFINWSYLYLGKLALINTNKKLTTHILILKLILAGKKSKKLKKGNQPPQKRFIHKPDISNILAYSLIKNRAKTNEEYSVL